jgi:hypothetical protein
MPRKEIRQMLEKLGESKVKQMLDAGERILGDVDSPYQYEVLLWLADKAEARLAARSALTLRIAILANIIAIIAIAIPMKDQILALIFGNP